MTEGPTLKIGDVVQLPSGGPQMTVVTAVDVGAQVDVRWMNNEGRMEIVKLPVDALQIIDKRRP